MRINYNAYGLEGPRRSYLMQTAKADHHKNSKEELDSASLLAILSETDLYKEMSRQTRRDDHMYDYMHQDWINVRSSNRLLSNLKITSRPSQRLGSCGLCYGLCGASSPSS